jgi:catechol 2,3-dioxygenase
MTMATELGASSHVSIDPGTRMGVVRLTVADIDRSRAFYERAIGLRSFENDDGTLGLGPSAEQPLVELHGDATAPALDPRATGLFHMAILVPSRRDLALALARLGQTRWPLSGASDHLVSEALYLSDPDGNGIEIYRDRARQEWRRTAGQLDMATLPLDLDDLLSELSSADRFQELVPDGAAMGHVHLQVSELEQTEAFYAGVLGFDVTVRGYPGALFVSAGGYHHHLGLNTWHSAGSSPPAPGSIGLRSFDVVLPSASALDAVVERARAAGIEPHPVASGVRVRDRSGNHLVLTAANGS